MRFHIRYCTTIKRFYQTEASKFFVATPIFYVNGDPHIGHLYTALIADAAARWAKVKNPNVQLLFSTGTDEHGQKVQQAAMAKKQDPNDYVSEMSQRFRQLFDRYGVCYSRFIRTSEPEHKEAVCRFWDSLSSKDLIYKSNYSGWYATVDEAFYSDFDTVEVVATDGTKKRVAKSTGNTVEWVEEENYMFRLSQFRDQLHQWHQTSNLVEPACYKPYLESYLTGLDDLSISRSAARLSWGIPVPGDPGQMIYVWLDALVNYLTVAGYPSSSLNCWPPDCQIVGKDILKFHTVYWPALLMAVSLPLPKKILCHGHWTVDDLKMSKSKGNVVDPLEEEKFLTVEGLRYFLLRHGVPAYDGNYNRKKAKYLLKNELADVLGNLLNRSVVPVMNPEQIYPAMDEEIMGTLGGANELIEALRTVPERLAAHYDQMEYYKAVDLICRCLRQTNAFYQSTTPWKHKNNRRLLDAIHHVVYESLRLAGLSLQPVIPGLSSRLLDRLGVLPNERSFDHFESIGNSRKRRHLGPDSGLLMPSTVVELWRHN